ncbi:MAG: hypothetical protein MJ103_00330 [Saccharofermentans sp.]|nr:hypothetical protein [Saccharofermentans sp.]
MATVTPTPEPTAIPTPEPTDAPVVENEAYALFSEGDVTVCHYRNPFETFNWNINELQTMYDNRVVMLNNVSNARCSSTYNGIRSFSPDYSLSGRITLSSGVGDGGGRFGFYIQGAGYSFNNNSIGIYYSNDGYIHIQVNMADVCSARYEGIKQRFVYNDIWYDYDSETSMFNVYAAEHTSNGVVVKPSEPLISYEIDFSELFSSTSAFTWSYYGQNGIFTPGTLILRGVEVDPYPAIHENSIPDSYTSPEYSPFEDGNYTIIMSQGDPDYGYSTEFIEENWVICENTTYSPDVLILNEAVLDTYGYAFLNTSQHIDEDYSFSLRYTYQIDEQEEIAADGIAFVIQPSSIDSDSFGSMGGSIGYQELTDSIIIESDIFSNYEVSAHHIALVLNGNSSNHYAIADYPELRDNDSINTMWVDYDGRTEMLYVYVATYGEDIVPTKPSEPLLTLNIDITEFFDSDDIYMGFTCATGTYYARFSVLGMEYCSVDFETPVIGMSTNFYYVKPGEPIEGYGAITGTDSSVQIFDEDGQSIYEEELDPSGEYEQLFSIDTTDIPEGNYVLVVSAYDDNGELITTEAEVIISVEDIYVPEVGPGQDNDEDLEDEEGTTSDYEFTDDELFVDIADVQQGMELYFVTDVTGTVTGSMLDSYKFEVIPVGAEEAVYTYIGTEAVEDSVLGTVDTTLMMNGYYIVKVTATADVGELDDSIVVLVTGAAKVGNFTISFLDMSLPVAGLPVEVYRTYDSRQRTVQGDFGYGWSMSIGGPSVSVSGNLGSGWRYETRRQLGVPLNYWTEEYPHEINIDWGNGRSETFSLTLSPDSFLEAPLGTISVSLVNSDGTSDTLTILDNTEGLSYDMVAGNLLNEDFSAWAPQSFLLTRYDGTMFYFNKDNGLYKVEDTYGRTIEITDSGIIYSEGGSISFNRDEQGRITSISDGLGNEVVYTYDEIGNLISVLDIAGYTTTFAYDESHYLTNITADNGLTVARNEYDDNGRLIATIDADGNRIEFSHNLDQRMEVTTDRLGYNTIYYYDERGNITSVTDALGRTTSYTYDENNNKTSETRPDGTTFCYSYDANGNILTANDGNGRTVTGTYGSHGEILTMSAMGVTELAMAYDSHGNLITVSDSAGNTMDYGYDNSGNITSVSDSLGSIMNMTYDSNGHLTSITNADGQVTNFSYDSEGRLISRSTTYHGQTLTDTYTYDAANRVIGISYANGNTVSYSYNQAGDVTASTDSQGRTVNYTYDNYGNLTYISYPDGTHESFTYDAEGRNLTATDRMGRTATFTYDAVGNCTGKTYPNGASESYSYDSCDRLISATNVYGATTSYSYDYLGRNTSVTDANCNTTTYVYNERGNVAYCTDALGNTYSFTYDNFGNQTSVTYPNGSTYTNTYDVRGRMTSQSDAYGNTTTFAYDENDRLVSVTDALGSTWSYTYDSIGNIETVTDSMGYVTSYGYDSYGQLISVTNAAGNTATTTYDSYGRAIATTDFGGVETTYTYDTMDRVISTTTNGEVTTYTYSSVGNLVSVTDPAGTIFYTYNVDGYLSSVTNADGEVVFYTYDEAGQISSISIDDHEIDYIYDSMGRIISVTDEEGTTDYYYDAVGNRVSTKYPNGVVTTYEYSENNVLVSQVSSNEDGEVLMSFEYTIGVNNERLICTELNRTVEYEYDELERLISETVTTGDEVSVTIYSYDSNSNRVSMDIDGEVTVYEYNELNQLISAGGIEYTWDNAGNLVSQTTSTGVIVASYTYDSQNRMLNCTMYTAEGTLEQSYTYDYLGNRTSKTTGGATINYTTDLSTGYSQVLKEEEESDVFYYTRGFELITRIGEDTSYYIYDGGMSVRGLTDESGELTDTYVFDAFGNEVVRTGTTDNSYGFQGEQRDETGLYYLRARYMNPSTGTFISMDTYGGSLSDPMSLHKNLFANSNPVKYCDPSGHMSLAESMCVFGIIGELVAANLYFWCLNSSDEFQEFDTCRFAFFIIIGAIVGIIIGAVLFVLSELIPLFTNAASNEGTVVKEIGKVKITISPGKTTTVVGRGEQTRLLADYLGIPESPTLNLEPNPGGINILRITHETFSSISPNFWEAINYPWLRNALIRGDRIIFASPILRNLFEGGRLTFYGREVLYILYYKIIECLVMG